MTVTALRTTGTAPAPSHDPGPSYTVRRGDSLWAIARDHGVSLAALEAANPRVASQRFIFPGDVLTIPRGTSAQGGSHVVVRGDTLSAIAQRNGTTWQALAQRNGLTDPGRIYPGQVIRLSGTAPARPTAPAPAPAPVPGTADGNAAAAIAASYLGQWSVDLRANRNDSLPMRADVSERLCCANFVSAVLIQAGMLPANRHQIGVQALADTLAAQGWTRVPAGAPAQAGDVAIIRSNGISHTELVVDSRRMIGSNGTASRGQQITYDNVRYATQNGGYFLRPPVSAGPAAPAAPAAARATDATLGTLSARYETAGRGPGTVSSGANDPGGASYGSYQLASGYDQPQAFLANEGARWASSFTGLRPGTPDFDRAWRAVAAQEPTAFHAAQHAYIERTHYEPSVASVQTATGLSLDTRSGAVRDAVWSTSVQHGSAARLLAAAVRAADEVAGRDTPAYDRALVNAIYDQRVSLVTRLRDNAASAGERRTFQSILDNRYPAERRDALAMLGTAR